MNRQVRYNTIKLQWKDEVACGVIRVNYHDGMVFSCRVAQEELRHVIHNNIIHMALKWRNQAVCHCGNRDGLMPKQMVSVPIRVVISPNHRYCGVGHSAKCWVISLHLHRSIVVRNDQGAMPHYCKVSVTVAFAT